MDVILVDHTPDPVNRIGEAASICYDSDTSREANLRRAIKCKDSGHLATMRFAYATFRVEGISRACSHQLVRMAHAGILQRSQRYVRESRVQYVDPPALKGAPKELVREWKRIQMAAAQLYQELIDHKAMRKEDARYILPQGTTTELELCLNFQAWQDFLRNRTANEAQWEVRAVALAIEKHLQAIAPGLF